MQGVVGAHHYFISKKVEGVVRCVDHGVQLKVVEGVGNGDDLHFFTFFLGEKQHVEFILGAVGGWVFEFYSKEIDIVEGVDVFDRTVEAVDVLSGQFVVKNVDLVQNCQDEHLVG